MVYFDMFKEIFSQVTWVDFLVIVLALRGCYVGYKSGLLPEFLRIVSYIVTVVAAFSFQEEFTQYLTLNTFLNQATAKALSLVLLLTAFFILAKLALWIFLKFLKIGKGNALYNVLGMVVGCCRWIILLSLLFSVIDNLPFSGLKKDIHEKSVMGKPIAEVAPTLFDYLSTLSPTLGTPKKAL